MFAIFFINRVMQSTPSTRRFYYASSTYEEAIRALNSLQSNADFINKANRRYAQSNTSITESKKYLHRSGLKLEDLDKLSVIHVAGTKGKGSTCAFIERILREHGYRTGFYSSPHLVTVCERFRINGQSIQEDEFAKHFWSVFKTLEAEKEHNQDMPQYFRFLTILMFHLFLKAKVDVAIVEVGIGGEHDCTNIIQHPICTGITSLGLDHTKILGDTIEEIAYQKSGIFKKGVPAFTVPQIDEAMNILRKRTKEKNCTLEVVPPMESYDWPNGPPVLGIQCSVQRYNASLAVKLSECFIRNTFKFNSNIINSTSAKSFEQYNNEPSLTYVNGVNKIAELTVNAENQNYEKLNCLCFLRISKALTCTKWPARTQVMCGRTMDFYIDGAHTIESIKCCSKWFEEMTKNCKEKKYLIFNATGDRDVTKLLEPFRSLNFHKVFFVPNVAGVIKNVDQENMNNPVDKQIVKCHEYQKIWGDSSVCASSVFEVLNMIKNDTNSNANKQKPKVLLTGSLHLAGALLSIIDPGLNMKTAF